MEASTFTPNFPSSSTLGFSSPSRLGFFSVQVRTDQRASNSKLKCAKEGKKSSTEGLNWELEQELIGIKKLSDKCKEMGGLVELLECLEREAIMGEDEGREPNDYNRRAVIFDRSSRVFQALKQTTSGGC